MFLPKWDAPDREPDKENDYKLPSRKEIFEISDNYNDKNSSIFDIFESGIFSQSFIFQAIKITILGVTLFYLVNVSQKILTKQDNIVNKLSKIEEITELKQKLNTSGISLNKTSIYISNNQQCEINFNDQEKNYIKENYIKQKVGIIWINAAQKSKLSPSFKLWFNTRLSNLVKINEKCKVLDVFLPLTMYFSNENTYLDIEKNPNNFILNGYLLPRQYRVSEIKKSKKMTLNDRENRWIQIQVEF